MPTYKITFFLKFALRSLCEMRTRRPRDGRSLLGVGAHFVRPDLPYVLAKRRNRSGPFRLSLFCMGWADRTACTNVPDRRQTTRCEKKLRWPTKLPKAPFPGRLRSRALDDTSDAPSFWGCNRLGLLAGGRRASAPQSPGPGSDWRALWAEPGTEHAADRAEPPIAECFEATAAEATGARLFGLENGPIPTNPETHRCTEAVRSC